MDNVVALTNEELIALFNKAIVLHNENKLEEAKNIYLIVLQRFPDHFDSLKNMSIVAYSEKDYDMAMAYVSRAMKVDPDNAIPISILGRVFLDTKEFDKAEICFKRAIAIDPSNAGYHCHMGLTLVGKKEFESAIIYLNKAIGMDPNKAMYYSYIASAYEKVGELDKSLAMYKKSFAMDGSEINTIYDMAVILSSQRKYEELFEFIEYVEKMSVLSEFQMIGLHINKAIVYFQSENIDSFRSTLNYVKNVVIESGSFPNYQNFKIYYDYLERLLVFKENNTSVIDAKYDAKLYIIGDSHCLSPAFTFAKIGNVTYKCMPTLVTGGQARHLANNKKNEHTAAFESALKNIADNSVVAMMFGEIDTRIDYGIIPYHKSIGKLDKNSIDETIKNIVSEYVDFCVHSAKKKNLKLMIYGIPAANINNLSLTQEDAELLRYVIKKMNDELRYAAEKNGILFIDIYKITVSDNGNASGKHHIDAIHLYPGVFAEACCHIDN